jgi:methyltransferase
VILGIVILALVTLQRVGELWLSNRNTARLLAHGAQEVGASHYPLIVAVHALWLVALWWLAPGRHIFAFWLVLYVLLEIARIAGRRGLSSFPAHPSSAAARTASSITPIMPW